MEVFVQPIRTPKKVSDEGNDLVNSSPTCSSSSDSTDNESTLTNAKSDWESIKARTPRTLCCNAYLLEQRKEYTIMENI